MQIKIYLCLLLILFIYNTNTLGQAALKLTPVNTNNLPEGVLYEGQIKSAQQWKDAAGQHLLLLTETGIYTNPAMVHENEGQDAQLFAYHYIVSNRTATLSWKINDYIQDCSVDIEANFIKNTLQVTDLDQNGVCEIWVMYVTACHGDVSPLTMKLIMYEGDQKYAMRGQNKIRFSPTEFFGGDYKFDPAFTEGPASFRAFAKKTWAQHITGT